MDGVGRFFYALKTDVWLILESSPLLTAGVSRDSDRVLELCRSNALANPVAYKEATRFKTLRDYGPLAVWSAFVEGPVVIQIADLRVWIYHLLSSFVGKPLSNRRLLVVSVGSEIFCEPLENRR